MLKGLKRLIRTGPKRSGSRLRFPEVARPDFPNPMPPPWVAFPDIAHDSIGWRMGSGETYLMDLHQWHMQPDDRAARQVQANRPAPVELADFYDTYEGMRRDRRKKGRRG